MAATVACGLALVGLVTLSAGAPTRASIMTQLERPAQPARLGRGFSATCGHSRLRCRLTLSVNRAGLPDPARLIVSARGGRPVTAAHVTLTYSMPSMNMWRVYSSRLEPVVGTPGAYAATEGVLGMPGVWRVEVTIARPGRSSERLALSDRMAP